MTSAIWGLLFIVVVCNGEQRKAVRIDTKVKIVDAVSQNENTLIGKGRVYEDPPFQEASETDGFYNRPRNSGRFPVRIENARHENHQSPRSNHRNELMQYCKCETTAICTPREDSNHACGPNKYLCCYKRPNSASRNSEVFNEIEDERPMLLPSQEKWARPFPPPPNTELNESFRPGHAHEAAVLGAIDKTLNFDSQELDRPEILVGPVGPLRMNGPKKHKPILTGPNGPTGIIGPTGILNPFERNEDDSDHVKASGSAQRGVLVGPGGPTGIVGPNPYGRRPILVGPRGPTGIIGPRGPGFGYRRPSQSGPGVLVGPSGPTGIIGPGRQLIVGPDGPSGVIGPQGYFGK